MNPWIWNRARAFATLTCAVVVFFNVQEFLSHQLGVAWLGYVDEIIVCSAYVVGPLLIRRKRDLWVLGLLVLPLASIAYGLALNRFMHDTIRFVPVVVQSIITFKLFLIYVLLFAVRIQAKSSAPFFSAIKVLSVLTFVGLVLNLVLPDLFTFSDYSWHAERGRVVGFQFKPNDAAIVLALLFAGGLFYLGGLSRWAVLVLCSGGVLVNTSRTALAIVVGSLVWHLIKERRYVALSMLSVSGAALCAIFIEELSASFAITETIKNVSEFSSIHQTQYIRAVMLFNGVSLALNWFPIGVGPGNFGTVMSADSAIYGQLGLSGIGALDDMSGIYDSNIASLLGEYGFVGFSGIVFILGVVFFRGFTFRNSAFFFIALLWVALTQPVLGYQVNAINFLIVMFAIEHFTILRSKAADGIGKCGSL